MSIQSEIYSDLLYRYQTDGVPKNMSIEHFCFTEGVEYRSFIRWYRENKARMHQTMKEELKVFPISILNPESSNKTLSIPSTEGSVSVESLHLKLSNGIELNKEKVSLVSIVELLENLRSIC